MQRWVYWNIRVRLLIAKAVNGDDKAREWLAKYGWSQRTELDAKVEQVVPILHAVKED
jgi:hypothetical protein